MNRSRPAQFAKVRYDDNDIARGLDVYCMRPLRRPGEGPLPLANLARGPQIDAESTTRGTTTIGPIGPATVSDTSTSAYRQITAYDGVGDGDFAVACHVRTPASYALSYHAPILSHGLYAPAVYLHCNTAFGAYHGGDKTLGVTLTVSTWQSLVVTRRSGVLYGYVNGALTGSVAYTNSWGSSAVLYLGADPSGSTQRFHGAISYWGFWRRGLMQKEALKLHVDPWCLIRPKKRARVIVPAAPAGSIAPHAYHYNRQRAA